MISRLRTLSMKTVRVPAEFIAPLLVLVGLAGAAIITVPFLALALAVLIYLGHLPYAVYRYRWLGRHPEAWYVAARQRRAAVRALRTTRPGLRPPLRGRVAGAARARAAALNNRRRREDSTATNGQLSGPGGVSGGGVPGATGVTGGVAGPAGPGARADRGDGGGGDGTSANWTWSNNICDFGASQGLMIEAVQNVTIRNNLFNGNGDKAIGLDIGSTGAKVSANIVGTGIGHEIGMDTTSKQGYQGPQPGGGP